MAKDKSKIRLYTLLFCIAVFVLTALGLVVLSLGMRVIPILPFFLMAWVLLLAFAADTLIGEGKLSWIKVLLLTFGVLIISTAVTQSVWIIVTPSWSFSVTTDKSTYRLGEHVEITVSLRNTGFITHSFESGVPEPAIVSVYLVTSQVWYSAYHEGVAQVFSLEPNGLLERDIVWNQTNIYFPDKKIEAGTYFVEAFIPSRSSSNSWAPLGRPLFRAWTRIEITAA